VGGGSGSAAATPGSKSGGAELKIQAEAEQTTRVAEFVAKG